MLTAPFKDINIVVFKSSKKCLSNHLSDRKQNHLVHSYVYFGRLNHCCHDPVGTDTLEISHNHKTADCPSPHSPGLRSSGAQTLAEFRRQESVLITSTGGHTAKIHSCYRKSDTQDMALIYTSTLLLEWLICCTTMYLQESCCVMFHQMFLLKM